MSFSVKLFKKLYFFYKLYYTLRVLTYTLWLWGILTWVKFWLTQSEYKEVQINEIKFLLQGCSLPTKLYELNIIIENSFSSNYLDPGFKINNGEAIIDIGAHIGSFCIPVAKKFMCSQIYAFEPEPENYELLLKNVKLNGVNNVKPSSLAIAGSAGVVSLFVDPHNSTGHSLTRKTARALEVHTTTLERILLDNHIEQCGLLKIDCEGAEYDILLNANSQTLLRVNNIAMEYHVPKYFDLGNEPLLEKLLGVLKTSGFEVGLKEVNFQIGYLKASRRI